MAGTDYDPYSILYADEPTAKEMALARAQALRGQNFAGLVGSLAHDPQASHSGQALMQQAQSGLEQLGQVPGERLRQATEQFKLSQAQREAAPYTDPAQSALLSRGQQDLAERLGGSLPAGASPETGQLLLQALEKAAGIQKFTPASYGTSGTIDTRTGKYTPFSMGGAGSTDPNALEPIPPAGKGADNYRKLALDFKKDMDAAASNSRSAFGQTANVVFRGARNLAILNQKNADGTQRQLTLPEWQEVTGGLISMQTGGAPTQEMMKEGLPHDVEGSVAGIMSWLTSNPHAPDRQAWIDRFTSNVNREEEAAKKFQRDTQMQRIPSHSQFFSQYPNRAKLAAQGYGIEPSIIDQVNSGRMPATSDKPPPPPPPAIDPAVIAHYKSKLQPGERLAINAQGKAKALAASDAVPPGFTEVPLGP